jgi:hypothetical protein
MSSTASARLDNNLTKEDAIKWFQAKYDSVIVSSQAK